MKLFALLVVSTAVFAQSGTTPPPFPAHAVNGDVTIDISDIQVPTSYGATETRAAVSMCAPKLYVGTGVAISFGSSGDYQNPALVLRSNGLYCATFVTLGPRTSIISIQINLSQTATFQATDAGSATSKEQTQSQSRREK